MNANDNHSVLVDSGHRALMDSAVIDPSVAFDNGTEVTSSLPVPLYLDSDIDPAAYFGETFDNFRDLYRYVSI